jgi:hypothetical protein
MLSVYLLLGAREGNADRVDAESISGRSLRCVFENVTQVATALRAANFGANHAVAAVFDQFDGIAVLRFIE